MRPLDPADGEVQLFACELRALRAAAGELPFWKMARRCEVSKSSLAAAVAGYELPSEQVAIAFVEVCGGDRAWWRERLVQAGERVAAARAAPGSGQGPASAVGSELVLARRLPAVRAMRRGEAVADSGGNTGQSLEPVFALPGARRRPRAVLAVALVAAAMVGASAAVLLEHLRPAAETKAAVAPPQSKGVPSPAAAVPTLRGTLVYDQTVGPGCPSTGLARISQDDFTETHKWNTATSADWTVPGCSNLFLYSEPTTATQPDRWQDDYEWYFDHVPKTAQCTFFIYIPDSPYARYLASYDWTAGDSDYLDSTSFPIEQSVYRGQWFSKGPYTFSTGQAMMMITDARGDAPTATLTAAAVRLACD